LIVGIRLRDLHFGPRGPEFVWAFARHLFTRGSSSTRKTKSRHRQSAAEALFHLERRMAKKRHERHFQL
jgi:hypothetical protein